MCRTWEKAGCQQWWDSVVPEILSEVKVLWVLVEGGRSARKVNVENLQDVNDFLEEVKGKERTNFKPLSFEIQISLESRTDRHKLVYSHLIDSSSYRWRRL